MDKLNIQQLEEENQFKPDFSNNENIKYRIEGTPLDLIKQPTGWFIALGQNRISRKADNRDDLSDEEFADNLLEVDKWNIIINLISLCTGYAMAMKEAENLKQSTLFKEGE